MLSIVAAIDEKRGLGKNNELLFKIPQDFVRMKKLTMGHPIIMGRRTFESIGRVLPERTNIIITRDLRFKINDLGKENGKIGLASQGVPLRSYVTNSLEEAIEIAEKSPGSDEIFIFGGGQIFKEAMEKELVDVLHLTVVEGDYGADTFFPDYSKFSKVLSSSSGTSGVYEYSFLDLARS